MSDPLLTIGAFARAVGLSSSALRHYDECGLLRPADVDEVTGYRYYTPDLAERAEMVSTMRDAGLSIDQMRTVLDGDDASVAGLLRDLADDVAERSHRVERLIGDLLQRRGAAETQVECRVSLRGPELASALRQVSTAAAQDPASTLSAVLIDVADGSLDVAATDRYWMAIRTVACQPPVASARVVLDLATAAQLAHALDRLDQTALVIGDGALAAEGHAYPVLSSEYPAHRYIVEGLEPIATRSVVPRAALLAAIESANREEIDIDISSDHLRLACVGRDVPAVSMGPALRLRMGSALLIRAIRSSVGNEIELGASTAGRPVRLSSPYQPGFLALVMPIAPTQ